MSYPQTTINPGQLNHPLVNIPLPTGLATRGINPYTCKLYHCYATTQPLEVIYHYATYDEPIPIGYKLRKDGWLPTQPKKTTRWLAGSQRCLFGLHLYDPTPTPTNLSIYLCEGETDAMALSQYYGNTPNHLALALGGTPTPDQWTEWLALLHSFGGTLHLCFDNDSQGASYLSTVESTYRGDYLILNLPQGVKDVADLLLGGEEPTYRTFTVPPNILGGDALLPTDEDRLSSAYVTTGYRLLDNLIGGYRGGSMIMLAGHPKAGKSTFLSALVVNYLKLSPTHKVLYIPLELSHTETLYTLASAHLAKPLPSCEPEEVLDAMRQLIPQLLMLRHFGYLPIEQLEETLAVIPKLGVTMLVLDHITAACTSFTDGLATRLLDSSLSYIQATLNRYQIPAIIVTHVNSSGLQSNDMLSPQHLRGSLALAQLPSVVLGVRRIDEGVTEVYTITPDRYTGKTGRIQFDYNGTFTPYKRGGDKFTL